MSRLPSELENDVAEMQTVVIESLEPDLSKRIVYVAEELKRRNAELHTVVTGDNYTKNVRSLNAILRSAGKANGLYRYTYDVIQG
jgi:hypothetical protein